MSKARAASPDRIHLLAHANPASRDLPRFGFDAVAQHIEFIRAALPAGWRLTCDRTIFDAIEEPNRGGRRDDARRIRDINAALADPRTLAIVALSGGGYVSRIIDRLDFSPLRSRGTPLTIFGFSEITSLVNLIAATPGGRGYYWLCPNYVGWKTSEPSQARAWLKSFFGESLPELLGAAARDQFRSESGATAVLDTGPIRGHVVAGTVRPGVMRVIGGCLSVLAAISHAKCMRRVRPAGKWLALEDINEAPHRCDRHLASLKLSGWLDALAGVLVGDFHSGSESQIDAVVELLRYHLPAQRRTPIVVTRDFGHTWPIRPLAIHALTRMGVNGDAVTLERSNERERPDFRRPRNIGET